MTEKTSKTSESGVSQAKTPTETAERSAALLRTRDRMGTLFHPNQFLGRKSAIGCVSLEISQRCNLDCSVCYLSANSNKVADLPLTEIFGRLETIRKQFGTGTNVQISGGDPTLRERKELVAIVAYARNLGLVPALFTNGIRCSRGLLEELAENGLSDVAFHVDLTQGRKWYRSEKELNAVRLEYLERTKGLRLMVIFNTTIHKENFHEIPDLVNFFLSHADLISMASFQLHAHTGRGTLRQRPHDLNLKSVLKEIDRGAQTDFPWETILIGHPECHKYAPALVVGGKAHPVIDDEQLFSDFLEDFSHVHHDRRHSAKRIAWEYIKAAANKPRWFLKALNYFLPRLWNILRDLIASRGRIHFISFFAQNFMDADRLDPERINACSFMVMTPEGSISMCAHNANRDDFILNPQKAESSERQEDEEAVSANPLADEIVERA